MNIRKRKLLAYLHDPPSKCADLATHEQRSERALRAAGFSEDELRAFAKQADLTASSADRFPFPGSRSSGMSCVFDGVRAGFHHPLGSGDNNGGAVLNLTLMLHKIAWTVFCPIWDKRLSMQFRVGGRQPLPVIIRDRHES